MKRLKIITGQTATGKTGFALDQARKTNSPVINFDSRQLYQNLNIVTGKDLPPETCFHLYKKESDLTIGFYKIDKISLWLYDLIDIDQLFSTYDYQKIAIQLIDKLFEHYDQIIFVGGSYLYIHHLLYINQKKSVSPNKKLRKKLEKLNLKELQKHLQTINKNLFQKLNKSDQNNKRRLIRKIELSQSIADYHENGLQFRFSIGNKIKFNPQIEIIGFKYKDKENLRKNIKKRVQARLTKGAIQEVKKLLKIGYSPNAYGFKTIGYQQIIQYLDRQINRSIMIDKWLNKEIQYAKRQLTFMKRDPHIDWRLV